ncbi:MAG TPA: glutamine amidotransferase [Syntrophomonadaceae bacterium]|nr:glutamine amidotransferase [Syntrophomonadaceae bacterium]
MAKFNIAHMYPDLMNLYGDRGNLICLKRRIEWSGHTCSIQTIHLGEELDYKEIDMLFMGGGSDREQILVYRDLLARADKLKEMIDNGLPVLCICGAYQLLGTAYHASDGTVMDGLGFYNFNTIGEKKRLIGNILIESQLGESKVEVVGFENHGGRTFLNDPDLDPFGKVIKGFGNNGADRTEGIKYKNLIGTYLHGPLLPKNPSMADWYIAAMASRKGIEINSPSDNQIENFARQQVKEKIIARR